MVAISLAKAKFNAEAVVDTRNAFLDKLHRLANARAIGVDKTGQLKASGAFRFLTDGISSGKSEVSHIDQKVLAFLAKGHQYLKSTGELKLVLQLAKKAGLILGNAASTREHAKLRRFVGLLANRILLKPATALETIVPSSKEGEKLRPADKTGQRPHAEVIEVINVQTPTIESEVVPVEPVVAAAVPETTLPAVPAEEIQAIPVDDKTVVAAAKDNQRLKLISKVALGVIAATAASFAVYYLYQQYLGAYGQTNLLTIGEDASGILGGDGGQSSNQNLADTITTTHTYPGVTPPPSSKDVATQASSEELLPLASANIDGTKDGYTAILDGVNQALPYITVPAGFAAGVALVYALWGRSKASGSTSSGSINAGSGIGVPPSTPGAKPGDSRIHPPSSKRRRGEKVGELARPFTPPSPGNVTSPLLGRSSFLRPTTPMGAPSLVSSTPLFSARGVQLRAEKIQHRTPPKASVAAAATLGSPRPPTFPSLLKPPTPRPTAGSPVSAASPGASSLKRRVTFETPDQVGRQSPGSAKYSITIPNTPCGDAVKGLGSRRSDRLAYADLVKGVGPGVVRYAPQSLKADVDFFAELLEKTQDPIILAHVGSFADPRSAFKRFSLIHPDALISAPLELREDDTYFVELLSQGAKTRILGAASDNQLREAKFFIEICKLNRFKNNPKEAIRLVHWAEDDAKGYLDFWTELLADENVPVEVLEQLPKELRKEKQLFVDILMLPRFQVYTLDQHRNPNPALQDERTQKMIQISRFADGKIQKEIVETYFEEEERLTDAQAAASSPVAAAVGTLVEYGRVIVSPRRQSPREQMLARIDVLQEKLTQIAAGIDKKEEGARLRKEYFQKLAVAKQKTYQMELRCFLDWKGFETMEELLDSNTNPAQREALAQDIQLLKVHKIEAENAAACAAGRNTVGARMFLQMYRDDAARHATEMMKQTNARSKPVAT